MELGIWLWAQYYKNLIWIKWLMHLLLSQTRKKSWRYGQISVSVHKLTTKLLYSSILYSFIVQMNYAYTSKSITIYKPALIVIIVEYLAYCHMCFSDKWFSLWMFQVTVHLIIQVAPGILQPITENAIFE